MAAGSSIRSFCSQLPGALGDPRSDADLLRAFRDGRDEAAFAALLRRHAAMVRGVCRRLLGDAHLAEDAAQASFLVLARRGGSVAHMTSLGGWLHEVARRCALKLRSKRWLTDGPVPEPGPCGPTEDPVSAALLGELREALDEEIRRLDAVQREAVVLHYLEGLSYAETARRLGWPRGTLATRLSQARDALRRRLTARGFDLSSVEAWGVIALAVSPVVGPAAWADAVACAAGSFCSEGPSVISSEVVRLSQEVMTMNVSAWKMSLACAGLLGVIGLATAQQGGTQPGVSPPSDATVLDLQPPAGVSSAPPGADPKREYLELLRKRVEDMSAEEVQAALAREREADRERQARQELGEILERLKGLVERYPDTQAAAKALTIVRFVNSQRNHRTGDYDLLLDFSGSLPPEDLRRLGLSDDIVPPGATVPLREGSRGQPGGRGNTPPPGAGTR